MRPSAFLQMASAALLLLSGCGYHTLGAATHLPPDIKTLAVPVFATRTEVSGTETALTEAVIREFASRTRFRVTPNSGRRCRRRSARHDPETKHSPAHLQLRHAAVFEFHHHDRRQRHAHRPRRQSPLPEQELRLPRAVPIHDQPAHVHPGRSRRHPAPVARICAAAGGRRP